MKRKTKKSGIIKKGPIMGIAVSFALLLMLTFVCAMLSEKGTISNELLKTGVVAACVISGFVGGYMSADGEAKSVLICAAVIAAVKAISAATGEESVLSVENITVFFALVASALAGGFTALRSKRKKRK